MTSSEAGIGVAGCSVVADLAAAGRRLTDADVPIEADDSGLDVGRVYIRDPFGNRIELVDARDAGFSGRG